MECCGTKKENGCCKDLKKTEMKTNKKSKVFNLFAFSRKKSNEGKKEIFNHSYSGESK